MAKGIRVQGDQGDRGSGCKEVKWIKGIKGIRVQCDQGSSGSMITRNKGRGDEGSTGTRVKEIMG